jgi:DNA-binding GntR family transcriptional regulator
LTVVQLRDIEPLDLPEGRRTIGAVHARLRELIMSGAIEPGTVLSQVKLAQTLGISRTPLREALRMLQEEGLIEAEPNQRARVTGFSPQDLDSVYGARVVLETLGASVTMPRLTDQDLDEAEALLDHMREVGEQDDFDAWQQAHRAFHRSFVDRVGEPLLRLIVVQAERSERYLRTYRLNQPGTWWAAGESAHRAIVAACRDRQLDMALDELGRHIARTALAVMSEIAPEQEPVAVRAALKLVLSAPTAPR